MADDTTQTTDQTTPDTTNVDDTAKQPKARGKVAGDTTSATSSPTTNDAGIGSDVHYVLDNGLQAGAHRPAKVVSLDEDRTEGRVNLIIFTDGEEDYATRAEDGYAGVLRKTSVVHNEDRVPNSWHWPEA